MNTRAQHEARARYEAAGYYLTPEPVLPADVVARAVEGMDAIRAGTYDTGVPPQPSPWNPGDDPGVLCKIEMPQLANRAVYEAISHPALGAWSAAVTGAERVQVWWVQLLYKPSSRPGVRAQTNVGWHQDYQYWQNNWEEGSELFTAWVALSDVTAESGPMHFVYGSHRWGFTDEGDFFKQDNDALRQGITVPDGETWEEVRAVLPPGGVSFHHCLTYHGSGPNVSASPRRSFAVHLCTEKSRLKVREGLTAFLDDPAYCPVIYDRAMALPS